MIGLFSCASTSDWIFGLGPQTSFDDPLCAPCYEYALISDASNVSLFVLARNVTTYNALYAADILAELQGFGWSSSSCFM